MSDQRYDVLVVGGGPAGAATAYCLARAGRSVCVVERKTFPRDKTCGDGLTPRAVHQLQEMGLGSQLAQFHRYDGLRAIAHGISLELKWPEHPVFPSYGYVVKRRDLDQMVADHAVAAGATLRDGTEAVAPILDAGLVAGAVVKTKGSERTEEIRARYVVVADGANSRFGRALGSARNRSYPQGMAIRGYFESPLHAEPWIESALDVRDRNGNSLPGYGWIFPVGDGTINVGIGLLSTFRDWKNVNTSKLMEEFSATAPAYWGISPATSTGPPTGGRLPMGGSVTPNVGPTWVLVGDAAGTINPFNGEGIDYAYETGRMAAGLLDEAIATGDGMVLQRYPALLEAEYALYWRVARLFAKVIGNPPLLNQLTKVGMQSRTLMDWVLRIMANLLRDDEIGPAEAVYKMVAAMVRAVPERGAA
ncbi:MAG: geranylgeranyl reductase family protein [Acidimicrobiales bacterium]